MSEKQSKGVPPTGSGHSAEPGSISVVSAETASVPNAAKWMREYDDGGERLTVSFDLNARFFSDTVRINQFESDSFEINVEFRDLRWLAARLLDVASAIEARQRTDPEEGLDPKDESAATEGGDAQEGVVRDHE